MVPLQSPGHRRASRRFSEFADLSYFIVSSGSKVIRMVAAGQATDQVGASLLPTCSGGRLRRVAVAGDRGRQLRPL